jgi:ATP-dependent DNA helicase RecG
MSMQLKFIKLVLMIVLTVMNFITMNFTFVNQLNNPDKMSPTLYLSIEEIEYEEMTLLWVFVPPTSTVEKCANRIYDRNEDGDMDITDSPIQLQNLYNRKSNTYAERKIIPYVTTADLNLRYILR